jgi:hypothetical protein
VVTDHKHADVDKNVLDIYMVQGRSPQTKMSVLLRKISNIWSLKTLLLDIYMHDFKKDIIETYLQIN